MFHKVRKTLIYCSALTLLSACGGGSGSGSTSVQTFTATAVVSGLGGTITPASREVEVGLTTIFNVTVDDGFQIDSVEGCDGTLNGTTFTTSIITADCSITASFSEILPPPQFNSPAIVSVRENQSGIVYIARATSSNGEQPTFNIIGGDDQSAFSINSITGELNLIDAADFENPTDANRDGVFEVTLEARTTSLVSGQLRLALTIEDITQLSLRVTYPTVGADLHGPVETTFVAGIVEDLEDGEVFSDDVGSIMVNGVQAELIPPTGGNSLFRWGARIPVSTNINELTIDFTSESTNIPQQRRPLNNMPTSFQFPQYLELDADNNRVITIGRDSNLDYEIISVDLESAERIVTPGSSINEVEGVLAGLGYDSINNRLLLINTTGGRAAVIAVDLNSGELTTISDANTGSGVNFSRTFRAVADLANNRALIFDSSRFFSVDLDSGDRVVISGRDVGAGPDIGSVRGLTLDSSNARLYGVGTQGLFTVDLDSGDRSIISDTNIGSGIAIDTPTAIALDGVNNRVLVAQSSNSDSQGRGLIEIDLSTGDRRVVSSLETGSGLGVSNVIDIALDTQNNRVLLTSIDLASNFLSIDLESGNRSLALPRFSIGSGNNIITPEAITIDSVNNRSLVTDTRQGGLFAVDLDSGDRTVISISSEALGEAFGSGVFFSRINGITLDANDNRAILVGDDIFGRCLVISVDLNSGDRTIVSGENNGEGPLLILARGIDLDRANNRAIVVDSLLDSMIAVDLTSGDRTILSGENVGSGSPFLVPYDVALDHARNRAIVADNVSILSVDLDNGNRTIISDANTGEGPSLPRLSKVELDTLNNRVIVLTLETDELFVVDLESGNRSILSGPDTNTGANFISPIDIALDSNNSRVYVTDNVYRGVIVVDLETGERAISSR